MALFSPQQVLSDHVKSTFPTQRFKFNVVLGSFASQRSGQSIGMMDPLAVAGHLAADDTRCVGVLRRAPDPPDVLLVDQFDFKRTSGRAVVWTGAVVDIVIQGFCFS